MKKASTLKEVASVAKCHPSTVSLALRNDPRIPEETRERIQKIANDLGYSANPLVSAWVSARRAGRPVHQHVSAAYLTCEDNEFDWPADEHLRSIFKGAQKQSENHGFRLTEFRFRNRKQEVARLNQILSTRGVRGVIFGPTLHHQNITGLEWERYSLITIGYGLTSPSLHRVAQDHHAGITGAFSEFLKKGYSRIGLAFTLQHNATRLERWVCVYQYEQIRYAKSRNRLPVFSAKSKDPMIEAKEWIQSAKPDAIITDNPSAWTETGIPTLGFTHSSSKPYSGVQHDNSHIGIRAMDLLAYMVLNNERGIPEARQTVLIEPSSVVSSP
ncbi:LacI family transcriptional regulator [Puniceicoccaceae bacterium K14]|nr:LacI family transcriptional regulator [Puniceicoccaceae bacterium K14]